jgi:hypothetical protein
MIESANRLDTLATMLRDSANDHLHATAVHETQIKDLADALKKANE